jgi:plasmid stabilization system protein ParE
MARLIVSIGARTDIRRIIDYLEEHAGWSVALRYAVEFDAAIDRIAELPGVGSPRSQFGQETRIVIVNPYLIFYEPRRS